VHILAERYAREQLRARVLWEPDRNTASSRGDVNLRRADPMSAFGRQTLCLLDSDAVAWFLWSPFRANHRTFSAMTPLAAVGLTCERAMKQAVETEALSKTYSSRAGTVEAVRGVDLRVNAGETSASSARTAPASLRRSEC
jgi:ABC-type glutathione transport system ATPase component